MDARGLLKILRARWISIAVLAIVGVGVAGGLSVIATPTYQASNSVFFSIQVGDSASDFAQGSTYIQNLVISYAEVATTPAVLDPVIDELGLDISARQLDDRVTATVQADTVIIQLTVSDTSPMRAADIANAVAASLAATVERLAPTDSAGRQTVQVTSVAPATVPTFAVSPNTRRNVAVGLFAGLLFGVSFAYLRSALDTRVRGPDDVRQVTYAPVLGSIGILPGGRAASLVLQDSPQSAQAEAYRQIRTNLQFLGVDDQARSIVVTSALPAEGKSTVAANLALALAETSARVLLVDADLRRPTVAEVMSLEGVAGLTTVLIGRAAFEDVVQEWDEGQLHILTSGEIPPNPSQLLGSEPMSRLLSDLESRYDFVIIDTAPLLPVTDAAVLSRVAVGTIVVANARRVRRHQLSAGLEFLDQVGANVLGVVLNEAVKDSERYGYTPHAVRGGAVPVSDSGPTMASMSGAAPGARPARGNRPDVSGEDPSHHDEDIAARRARERGARSAGPTPDGGSTRGAGRVAGAAARHRRRGNDRRDPAIEGQGSSAEVAARSRPRPRPGL